MSDGVNSFKVALTDNLSLCSNSNRASVSSQSTFRTFSLQKFPEVSMYFGKVTEGPRLTRILGHFRTIQEYSVIQIVYHKTVQPMNVFHLLRHLYLNWFEKANVIFQNGCQKTRGMALRSPQTSHSVSKIGKNYKLMNLFVYNRLINTMNAF